MTEIGFLKSIYLFQRLSDETLAAIAERLQPRQLAPNEILFNIGDPGNELFIVKQGRMAIFAPSTTEPGKESPIRIFQPGQVLGEMALIDREPRSLSARALEPTTVLVLGGEHFLQLLRDDDHIAFAVMGGLSDRIRYTTKFLNEVRGWVRQVADQKYDPPADSAIVGQIRGWVRQVADQDYEQPFEPAPEFQDQTLLALAAEFAHMATQVQKRESELKHEIAQLRIEIDEARRQREVSTVVETDYFKDLKAKSRAMREAKVQRESEEG
jgi:CRP-like cAMP-binding protein